MATQSLRKAPRAKPTTAPKPKAATARRTAQAQPIKPAARKATVPKAAPHAPSRKLAIEPAVKIPSLSPKGKVLGRPRLDREPMGKVQTRIPGGLSSYLKILSLEKLPDQPAPFGTMTNMFAALFTRFVDEQPWRAGLAWRESHAVARFADGTVSERTEWKQLNIQLPIELARRVEAMSSALGRSQSSFCYTALCWWGGLLYPPVAANRR